MKIKKLHLKKYKRFSDLTIDLGETPKRIIALVGPNGCGKSSVFDAMLFHNNAYNRIGNTGNKTYLRYWNQWVYLSRTYNQPPMH